MIEKSGELVLSDLHRVLSQLGDAPLLEELEQDILGQLLSNRSEQINHLQTQGRISAYNRILSETPGPCQAVLVAYCLKPDNFDKQLEKVINHIETCPHTERIYLITTKWRPDVWEKHERTFRIMPAKLSVIMFAMDRLALLSTA